MTTIPDVADLTLDEKIGQVLCFGWQGATDKESRTANAHARELVESMRVGSVVLMGRNVNSASPLQTRDTLAELQGLSRIPLFVAIDQEGGSVNRFRAPFHEFPGNMALGAVACGAAGPERAEELARKQALAQARELLAVGVNWNFAPVVDVNNNPDNPIIGVRSYGEDPRLVASLGPAAMHGYQEAGLLACAKHFPGHGDTAVDSHLALPTITGDRRRLDAIEIVPFRALIRGGVGAIMTTHILFPALDPARPATLSRPILTGLLREELGYDGLVITDCLEMDAIAGTIGTPQGAVEALKAGADIVLVCHTLETQRQTVSAIRRALESGVLAESRLNEAVARVLAAKRRFLSMPAPPTGTPWTDSETDALEREIAAGSITVVRNGGAIPVLKDSPVLVASMHTAAARFVEILRESVTDIDVLRDFAQMESTSLDRYGAVIVLTCPREPWSDSPIDQEKQAQMVSELERRCRKDRLIVVAIREPYDIRRFPTVSTCVCTFGYQPASLAALACVLTGDARASGGLPVTIPGTGHPS
jgi:beta-N-acetylhexosaminidase